jgi:hypothetical protein
MDASLAKPIGIILGTILVTAVGQWKLQGEPAAAAESAAARFGAAQWERSEELAASLHTCRLNLTACQIELMECRDQ